jgi:hypothetical protein
VQAIDTADPLIRNATLTAGALLAISALGGTANRTGHARTGRQLVGA